MARARISGPRVLFECPGCNCMHGIIPKQHALMMAAGYSGPAWEWNGDLERPTFNPSILVSYGDSAPPDRPRVCHSFVRDGRIEFCQDSTHALAGQTVDLPDFDKS